jgi:hypothetical protein
MTINNLYVHYDDDGGAHHFINDEEVPKDVWTQQHPHLKRGQDSGRNRSEDGGSVGLGAAYLGSSDDAEVQYQNQVREGLIGLAQIREDRAIQRARSARDELGQRQERPESP